MSGTEMCTACGKRPALSDARFGGLCYVCAGRPALIPRSPEPKREKPDKGK